jgi:hypothetical protein
MARLGGEHRDREKPVATPPSHRMSPPFLVSFGECISQEHGLLLSDQLALAAGFLLSRHVTPPLFNQNLLPTSMRTNGFSRSAGDGVPLRT